MPPIACSSPTRRCAIRLLPTIDIDLQLRPTLYLLPVTNLLPAIELLHAIHLLPIIHPHLHLLPAIRLLHTIAVVGLLLPSRLIVLVEVVRMEEVGSLGR
jgi:hypothetical protein